MQVEIRSGGDGVACWNADAIAEYAAAINDRQALLIQTNPDLVVTPGRIHCYGCEVLEFDMGVRCTASLTKTLYAVEGEVRPRKEDASASLSEIPGLLTRIDADPATTDTTESTETADVVADQVEPSRRSGLRGLFGRRT